MQVRKKWGDGYRKKETGKGFGKEYIRDYYLKQ